VEIPSVQHGDTPESEDIIFTEAADEEFEFGAGDCVRGAAGPRITIESVHKKRTTALSYKSGDKLKRNVLESKGLWSSSVSNAIQPYRSSTLPKEIPNRRVSISQ